MLFLKSLVFIVWNIFWGLVLIYLLRWFLFNLKARYIFGKRCILTPGFLVRKREWLFVKARDLLQNYIYQAENPRLQEGYLKQWELKIRAVLDEKSAFVKDWRFLPAKLKEKIRIKLVDTIASMASKFLRKTVPRLIEQWRIEYQLDDLDDRFDIHFILRHYNRYVHKYLVWFFVAINLIIGIMNMILFLIIA